MLKEFFTEEKVQELCEDIIAAGNRWHGIQRFSGRHSLDPAGVKSYFYKHIFTPELAKKLPKAQPNSSQKTAVDFTPKWSSEMDKALIAIAQNSSSQRQASIRAASLLGVSVDSAHCRLRKLLKRNPGLISGGILKRELHKAFLRNKDGLLAKEDIDAAARAAGVHYATALAMWGNMVKSDDMACKRNDCQWLEGEAVCSIRHNCPWHLGKVFSGLVSGDEDYDSLAAATRMDRDRIKEMVDVYRAFSDNWEPSLTYQHHVCASRTDDPRGWLEKALKNRWTEFQLKNAIEGASMKGKRVEKEARPLKDAFKLEEEIQALREDSERIKGENESLKAAVKALEEENHSLKAVVSAKEEEIGKLKAANGELEANLRQQEELINLVSLEYLKEVQDENDLLIKKLAASRKVNLYLMETLCKKTAKRPGPVTEPQAVSEMEMVVN